MEKLLTTLFLQAVFKDVKTTKALVDIIFNEKKREFSEILKYLNLAASIDVLAIHGEAKTKDHDIKNIS